MGTWTPEEIRAFRKQHKLSKRALGEIVGVSKNYIYYLEKGVRNPGKTLCLLLDRIAKELEENEKGKERDSHGKKSKRSL